jgi:Ca2+-binding RTX toxin-like protein
MMRTFELGFAAIDVVVRGGDERPLLIDADVSPDNPGTFGALLADVAPTEIGHVALRADLDAASVAEATPIEAPTIPEANAILAASRPSEARLSADGSRIFSAASDGAIRVYDARSGALLNTWQIGQGLGGMDISPDGSFLVAVDTSLKVTYRIDTTTGAKTTYAYTTTGLDGLMFDVAVLSDGTALFTQNFNGSGWTALSNLNLGTGVYTSVGSVRQSSWLTRTASGDRVLIGESNISNGQLDVYQTGVGPIANGSGPGFNWGVQAYSGSFAAHYIYNVGIRVYNASLQFQTTLTTWLGTSVVDLAFSPDSAFLYVLVSGTDSIYKIATSNWSTVATIAVGAAVGNSLGSGTGSRLILDPAGRYFSVVTNDGLLLVQNTANGDINGTANTDTLHGALFADTINGLGGDDWLYGYAGNDFLNGGTGHDWLDGGTGADAMVGGSGDDTYIVDDAGDTIDESGGGLDLVRTSLTAYTLAADVERVIYIGTGGATLTGNALVNVITAGAGNDTLDGAGNVDYLFGMAGDDRLIVGTIGSGSSVDGGTGTDTLAVSGIVSLGGLAGIEAIELAAGATLTLTSSQAVSGLAAGTAISGPGSLVVNMAPTDLELALTSLTASGGASITINGSTSDDAIKGALQAANTINGGGGADQIRGGGQADIINGGDGNDKIIGANGADVLTGGTGADTFRFQAVSNSGIGAAADRITDFVIGTDRLAFTLIDTDPVAPGDQGFAFIGTAAFGAGGAAQMRYVTSGADLLVQADVNGDGIADMEIVLQGLAGQTLTSGDFLL